MTCEQQSSEDVCMAVGGKMNQCMESRFSQRRGRDPWRKPGMLKRSSRSSQEHNMLIVGSLVSRGGGCMSS